MTKVMLIEDDDIMISLLHTLLEIEGFEIANYSIGEDLLTAIDREKPEIVLLDVHLRDHHGREVNGFDYLQIIRQKADLDSVQVIVSSGLDFQEKSVQAGANGFVHKPYMPNELIQLIKRTIP